MTDEETLLSPDILLDPATWAESYEEFPGKVIECRFRPSGEKYNETLGLMRPIKQWQVIVERLDAIYDLPDGTTAPVRVYLTIDLERQVGQGPNARIVASLKKDTESKGTFCVGAWIKAGFDIGRDPSTAEGTVAMFRRWRSKQFGTLTAKNLLIPTEKLPAGYSYEGEISRFVVQQSETLEEAAAPAAVNFEDVAAKLVGQPADDPDVALLSDPVFAGNASLKTALVSGKPVTDLQEKGLITVDDGVIALA